MNKLHELEGHLIKLKRNEQQMTEEQKKNYAKPLKALRIKILHEANCLVNDLFRDAITPYEVVDKAVLEAGARKIINHEIKKGTFINIVSVLFKTYSITELLRAVMPIYLRIRYEVYAPYWVEHCKVVDGLYYNTLINATYIPEFRIWKKKQTMEYTSMLPPTLEEVNMQYQKEREEFKKC